MGEEIPYTKPYDKPRQDHDTYRDQEEAEYEKARRKGDVLSLVEKDAQKAMDDLFAEPVAEEKPVAKKAVAKKTAKKAAKKSAKSK